MLREIVSHRTTPCAVRDRKAPNLRAVLRTAPSKAARHPRTFALPPDKSQKGSAPPALCTLHSRCDQHRRRRLATPGSKPAAKVEDLRQPRQTTAGKLPQIFLRARECSQGASAENSSAALIRRNGAKRSRPPLGCRLLRGRVHIHPSSENRSAPDAPRSQIRAPHPRRRWQRSLFVPARPGASARKDRREPSGPRSSPNQDWASHRG